jgi:phage shock protein PspC (stress-responsive transcriptional regulator)
MNKVVTVSISGIVFTIDENAYMMLKTYLDRLKLHFANTEGRDEILADIESRIAEMLTERLKGRNVVEETDIEGVIALMGKPEDMAEGEPAAAGAQSDASAGEDSGARYEKRVFRDPDDQVIGGVCSGIASYFGFDPLLLRLGFVVAFFGFGTGLLLYIILWIIIPKAKTPSERLQMKGERVNVSNIEKTVKEKFDTFGEEVKDFGKHSGDRLSRFFRQLWEGLRPVGRIIIKFIAVMLVAISIAIIIAMLFSTLGIAGVFPAQYPDFVNDIFDSPGQMTWAALAAALVVGVPFLALLYYSLRVILNIKGGRNSWIGAAFTAVWLAGIILAITQGIKIGSKFRHGETVEEEVSLKKITSDTLYIEAVNSSSGWHMYNTRPENDGIKVLKVQINEEDEPFHVRLDIRPSKTGEFRLIKEMTARGSSRQEAYNRASQIEYNFKEESNRLEFDRLFSYRKDSKWRAQELSLTLQVPVGKVIVLRDGMESIIYNIANEQNMWDGDMIGYHWLMNSHELDCLDCPENPGRHPIRHVNLVIL